MVVNQSSFLCKHADLHRDQMILFFAVTVQFLIKWTFQDMYGILRNKWAFVSIWVLMSASKSRQQMENKSVAYQ